jgi:hypothetical protein
MKKYIYMTWFLITDYRLLILEPSWSVLHWILPHMASTPNWSGSATATVPWTQWRPAVSRAIQLSGPVQANKPGQPVSCRQSVSQPAGLPVSLATVSQSVASFSQARLPRQLPASQLLPASWSVSQLSVSQPNSQSASVSQPASQLSASQLGQSVTSQAVS